jgi:hypothetical protein
LRRNDFTPTATCSERLNHTPRQAIYLNITLHYITH